MKDNQQFMQEIYKKYEQEKIKRKEHTKEKQILRQRKMIPLVSIAAMFLLMFGILIFDQPKIEETKQMAEQDTKEIQLAKLNDFDHLYEILHKKIGSQGLQEKQESSADQSQNSVDQQTKNKNYSTTNSQEEKVDEADIVKTDGRYLYQIINQRFIIVDTIDPSKLEVISQIDFQEKNFMPEEMYLQGKYLILLGSDYENNDFVNVEDKLSQDKISYDGKMICYLYNIEKKEQPKEIRKIKVKGDYLQSRMIGSCLYFIVNQRILNHSISQIPKEQLNENDFMPSYTDTLVSQEEKNIALDEIYYFEQMEEANYLILGGIDLEKQEEVEIKTFLGAGETVYCSEQNLYLSKTKYVYDSNTKEVGERKTQILKFALKDGKIKFKAETEVAGYVNNSFSMGEENGYFRIATTLGEVWNVSENTSNSLFILDKNLNEIGRLENFAKGEKIYAVRYQNNKAYVVTYQQTDPLFVIDLKVPNQPTLLGEVKLPGYSTYLHFIDDTHLLGFGYETKSHGTSSITEGLKIVLFDVSDYQNPKVIDQVKIGNQYTASEALYNYKAFLFVQEKNILAFPLTQYNINPIEYQAQFYQMDLEKGIIQKGEVKTTGNYQNKIERIIWIKDHYYILSGKQMKCVNQEFQEVGKLDLSK